MAYPNAGLPNDLGEYDEAAAETAAQVAEWIDDGLVNIVGGCCGTTPAHIAAIAAAGAGQAPAQNSRRFDPHDPRRARADDPRGMNDVQGAATGARFVNIGERTNVTGSAKFKKLILAGDYDAAVEVARNQVENGAQIIDVNMDEGLLDSEEAMTIFLKRIAAEPDIARVPVMIDSVEMERDRGGAQMRFGQADRQFDQPEGRRGAVPRPRAQMPGLWRGGGRHGVRRDRPGRLRRRARSRFASAPTSCWSAKVFRPRTSSSTPTSSPSPPGSTSIAATRSTSSRPRGRSARAAPDVHISGGLSNLSFSFRGNEPVRRAMHSVFLKHAIPAGMDMAIVNAGQFDVYDAIDPELREACEDVVLDRPRRRRHRAAGHARREVSRLRSGGREAGARMARLAGRRAARPRLGQGHRRVRRRGYRGSPPGRRPPDRGDRRAR